MKIFWFTNNPSLDLHGNAGVSKCLIKYHDLERLERIELLMKIMVVLLTNIGKLKQVVSFKASIGKCNWILTFLYIAFYSIRRRLVYPVKSACWIFHRRMRFKISLKFNLRHFTIDLSILYFRNFSLDSRFRENDNKISVLNSSLRYGKDERKSEFLSQVQQQRHFQWISVFSVFNFVFFAANKQTLHRWWGRPIHLF